MTVIRRHLQIALGVIWLLDAALQFQPYMFSRSFATQLLAPTAQGNPGWVASPINWAASLVAHHPVPLNALFATVQLALAIGLLWRRTVKLALLTSIPWAFLVWWLGEGLGGVLTGSASPLMGAPGAVILYALLAVLLWPRPDIDDPHAYDPGVSVAEGSVAGPLASRAAWLVLWASCAYEMLTPVNRSADGAASMIGGMVAGQPGWIASINRWASSGLTGNGATVSVLVAVAMAAIAISVYARPAVARTAMVLAAVVALGIWVVGEDFGGIFTGSGTDPNTGPLLVLLALAYWPQRANLYSPSAALARRRVRLAT